MKTTKAPTSEASEILHNRFNTCRSAPAYGRGRGRRINAHVARQIHELRAKAGLSQRDLGKLVGTTASVICRLEDADYDGPSLSMLRRIAAALDRRVEIRFVPA